MTPYILTVWLIYSDPTLPPIRTPYPDLAQCLAAQAEWQARAIAWMQRTGLKATGPVIVSRCDPPGGAATLREAHLMSYPYQVPIP